MIGVCMQIQRVEEQYNSSWTDALSSYSAWRKESSSLLANFCDHLGQGPTSPFVGRLCRSKYPHISDMRFPKVHPIGMLHRFERQGDCTLKVRCVPWEWLRSPLLQIVAPESCIHSRFSDLNTVVCPVSLSPHFDIVFPQSCTDSRFPVLNIRVCSISLPFLFVRENLYHPSAEAPMRGSNLPVTSRWQP